MSGIKGLLIAVAAVCLLGTGGLAMEVKREGNHVFIDGLQEIQWGCGKNENSVFGGWAAYFQAMGADIGYEYLMGISACAFRLQVSQPGWCPSSPHAAVGFDCGLEALAVLPYKLEPVGGSEVKADDAASMERLRSALVAQVDRGMPAIFVEEEESLLVGYVGKGEEFLYRKYCPDGPGYVTMKEWPWVYLSFVPTGKALPSLKEAGLRALKRALELDWTESFESYASGANAYRLWIARLRDTRAVEKLEGDEYMANMMGNSHIYYCLVDARSAAVKFLDSLAGELDGKAAKQVAKVAGIYRQVVKILTPECPTKIAPWYQEDRGKWTQPMRLRQADLLEKAAKLESKAMKAIAAAIKAMEG